MKCWEDVIITIKYLLASNVAESREVLKMIF